MKLAYVEMSGFRGFKDKARIEFSNGFTVICGRNGVGKSTICDAIEYAVTGEINKYRVEKSDKESLSDYVWWRGGGKVEEHYVSLGLSDEAGKIFEIKRSREEGLLEKNISILDLLCAQIGLPETPLSQLCKTSIIRDEWISAQSLDLKETERFELVSSALGELDSKNYGEKSSELVKFAKQEVSRLEVVYDRARKNVADAIAELSEARSLAEKSGNISEARENLAKYINDLPKDFAESIIVSKTYIGEIRSRISVLQQSVEEIRILEEERNVLESKEFQEDRKSIGESLAKSKEEYSKIEETFDVLSKKLEAEKVADDIAESLAKLIEGGRSLGLNDGACPLCYADQTQEEFNEGISRAIERAGEIGKRISDTRNQFEACKKNVDRVKKDIEQSEERLYLYERRIHSYNDRSERQIEFLAKHNFEYFNLPTGDEIEKLLHDARNILIEVERNVGTLESSKFVAHISELEESISELRRKSNSNAAELERYKKAFSLAQEMDRSIRRTGAEIIDERLAAISPLLTELYQRLKPHSDWRSIEYSIRGDVRRFLSLKVGDQLNPQFVFSSGQRRVAGIAFLLSVYLSRPWCLLNSLILDDPVQHIDDYRAIHLVELLSVLRRSGHQIICTVEDSSLASLLSRRLSGSPDSIGSRIELNRNKSGKALIDKLDISVFPAQVMRLVSESKA